MLIMAPQFCYCQTIKTTQFGSARPQILVFTLPEYLKKTIFVIYHVNYDTSIFLLSNCKNKKLIVMFNMIQ